MQMSGKADGVGVWKEPRKADGSGQGYGQSQWMCGGVRPRACFVFEKWVPVQGHPELHAAAECSELSELTN